MKQYNGEKAIISLTSWKARINTVSKTIYSLIQKCPGFHIVLVLSEEEFPQKEAELPDDLMLLADSELIEILWVYKNYKSFKKVLFTMNKYHDVPVISADDDCIYTKNYAQVLFDIWLKNKTKVITNHGYSSGFGILFPPNVKFDITKITQNIINTNNDDAFYHFLFGKLYKVYYNRKYCCFTEMSKVCPISTESVRKNYNRTDYINKLNKIFKYEYNK